MNKKTGRAFSALPVFASEMKYSEKTEMKIHLCFLNYKI